MAKYLTQLLHLVRRSAEGIQPNFGISAENIGQNGDFSKFYNGPKL